MIRTLGKYVGLSVAVFCLMTSLAMAGGMTGTVTQINDKGMATVKMADGKEHVVKGEGWKVGATVECEVKEGNTVCKAK